MSIIRMQTLVRLNTTMNLIVLSRKND